MSFVLNALKPAKQGGEMSVDIQSNKIVTKSLPQILNEIKGYARAANEAATNAKLAAEEVKKAKEAEAKATLRYINSIAI